MVCIYVLEKPNLIEISPAFKQKLWYHVTTPDLLSCIYGPHSPKKYPEDHQMPGFFFFHWQTAQPSAVQDNLSEKTQDLSNPIMQQWVKLGFYVTYSIFNFCITCYT